MDALALIPPTYAFFLGVVGLFLVYKYLAADKYTRESNRLRNQMASLRRDFPEMIAEPKGFVGKSLKGIGIEGLVENLGLPPMAGPFINGIMKYAVEHPDQAKAIAKRFGIDLDKILGGGVNQSQEAPGFK